MSYESMDAVRRQDVDREKEAALYAADRRDDYARSRCGTCDQCGSSDGMRGYDREAVQWFVWAGGSLPTLWRWHADPHHLYDACHQCNQGRVVPEGYERMSREQIQEWLGTPCDCAACLLDRGEIPIGGKRE